MHEVKEKKSAFLDFEFTFLPGYARFIYERCLDEFVRYSVSTSYELNLPILKHLTGYTREDVFKLSLESNKRLLAAIFDGDVDNYLLETQRTWLENLLPTITKEKVLAEDITLSSFIRRKAFRHFLPQFSNDGPTWLKVMQEVDQLTVIVDSSLFNTLIQLQQKEISDANVALHQREEQLLEAQSIANCGSFDWNLREGTSTYSPQVSIILDLGDEPREGLDSFFSFIHAEDRLRVKQALDQSFISGDFTSEYRYEKENRLKYILCLGKVSFDDTGRPARMIGTIMDITERQQIIRKLEESETRNKQAQALTHIGNWSFEPGTGNVEWSDELYRIFGLEPQSEKITIDSLLPFFPNVQDRRLLQVLNLVPATGSVPERYWHIIRRDGTPRIIKGKGEVIRDIGGNSFSIIGTAQDVTQEFELTEKLREREQYLKELNQSLAQKNEQLELKNRELESFNFIASHDLQEPLRKIQIFSNRILTETREPLHGETLNHFGRISEAAARMQKLIDDFLAFSQTINSPRTFEWVELADVIEEAKADMHARIIEKKACIKTAPLPTLKIIPFQVKQLFVNLISNSLKYSKDNVPPLIQISAVTPPCANGEVRFAQITFSDNGIGFDQKYADRIFELFQRLHNKNRYSGTGIGLALCRKICENHGGSISVTSEPGVGTTFHIALPME
jgi:signal transduction histidine kinase